MEVKYLQREEIEKMIELETTRKEGAEKLVSYRVNVALVEMYRITELFRQTYEGIEIEEQSTINGLTSAEESLCEIADCIESLYRKVSIKDLMSLSAEIVKLRALASK
jgi:hypothetical protein